MSENTPVQADEAASAPAPGAAEPSFVNDPVLSADLPQAAPEQKLTAGAAVTPPSAPEPAVHAGITVDERAYAQYQALAKAVLDSAEIASRSAEAAIAVSREMKHATGQFKALSDAGYKKARLLLAIGGGVMIVCLLFFLIMGVRMVSRRRIVCPSAVRSAKASTGANIRRLQLHRWRRCIAPSAWPRAFHRSDSNGHSLSRSASR